MVEEVNSCMIYLKDYKNLCKCHNVSPPITTIKEKKNENRLQIQPRGAVKRKWWCVSRRES
jgi:hypothetical protein